MKLYRCKRPAYSGSMECPALLEPRRGGMMNLDRSRVMSGILYEQTRHSCDIVEEAGTNGQRVHG